MDQFSNLEHGSTLSAATSFGAAAAAALAPDKQNAAIQFPGEDGGRSLTAWARRDLEATLQLLADRAQYITGGSGAAIALRDGERIICRASSGPSAPEVGSYLQVSSGLSGESVRTRKILSCDNAAMDPRVNHDSCRALGIASFVVMPLVRDGDVVGIFEIFSAQPHAFHERDLQALERMGEMVNTALDQVKNPKSPLGTAALDMHSPSPQPKPVSGRTDAATELVNPASPAGQSSTEPVASSLQIPEPQKKADDASTRQVPIPSTAPSDPAKPGPVIGTCASCGFPVSPGRAFCVDCESSIPEKLSHDSSAQGAPAFLADLADSNAQSFGVKQWIVAHRYLLGTILVLGGTAALLLLR